MKPASLALAALTLTAIGGKLYCQPQPPPAIASTVDLEIGGVEKQIVEVAETMPEDKYNFSPERLNIPGGDGPENLQSKAGIIRFLKDSFAQGHKAAATLTVQNMLEPATGTKSLRLQLAAFGATHASDHYGQMVEYLRMNGIVPPASR
jgi:hypothetical protein